MFRGRTSILHHAAHGAPQSLQQFSTMNEEGRRRKREKGRKMNPPPTPNSHPRGPLAMLTVMWTHRVQK